MGTQESCPGITQARYLQELGAVGWTLPAPGLSEDPAVLQWLWESSQRWQQMSVGEVLLMHFASAGS